MEMNDVFFVLKFVLALFVFGLIGLVLVYILILVVFVILSSIFFPIEFLAKLSIMNPYIKQHLRVIGDTKNYEDYIEAVERDERKSGKSSGERMSKYYNDTGLEEAEDDKEDKKKKKKKKNK